MAKKSLKGRELEAADKNWLVSYADMMTGLVLLFALMFVMTTVRAQNMVEASKAETAAAQSQVTELKTAAQKQTAEQAAEEAKGSQTAAEAGKTTDKGGTDKATTTKVAIPTAGNTKAKTAVSPAAIHPTKQGMQSYVNQHGDLNSVGVKQDSEGIKFVIQASVLFDPGSSQLRSDSYHMLNELGAYLKTLDSDIVISGHTDNLPVQSKNYQSNWELSCDRAVKVLRYLTDSCSVNPKRFMAIGYGEYKPVADNATAKGRDQNDRVEILVAQK